jgi:hypothetical protein
MRATSLNALMSEKSPVTNSWKMTRAQMRRSKVIFQASPFDSQGLK